MLDLIEEALLFVSGAVVCASSYFYGLFRGHRQARGIIELEREAAGLTPVKPLCLCKHYLSYHDAKGVCRKEWTESRFTSIKGDHDVRVTCTCQKYVGPEPLPEFYAPEISP